MKNREQTYLRIITSLTGVIILLILFMDAQPPKIETVEIIKEIEVVKDRAIEVEIDIFYETK